MATAIEVSAIGGGRHRAVYALRNRPGEAEHERVAHLEMAARIAELLKLPCGGECSIAPEHCYLVPDDTIIGLDKAAALGIRDELDLFGGVVAHPFMATKAITHPLVEPDAAAPAGWTATFERAIRDVVLPGFTAFSPADALRAGERLLGGGRVRVKATRGRAGLGQVEVADSDALHRAVGFMDPEELSTFGVVLEEDLKDVVTFSVGQVRVPGLTASYCGTQRLTTDNEGRAVYGGSDLAFVRGDMEALHFVASGEAERAAIDKAREYDAAALRCFPGLCASRRNYDVALGTDACGRRCCGVLEQSWRVGGATPAEIVALEMFDHDRSLNTVHASCIEIYGDDAPIPPGAAVFFSGFDNGVGPVTKYARVKPHGGTQQQG